MYFIIFIYLYIYIYIESVFWNFFEIVNPYFVPESWAITYHVYHGNVSLFNLKPMTLESCCSIDEVNFMTIPQRYIRG